MKDYKIKSGVSRIWGSPKPPGEKGYVKTVIVPPTFNYCLVKVRGLLNISGKYPVVDFIKSFGVKVVIQTMTPDKDLGIEDPFKMDFKFQSFELPAVWAERFKDRPEEIISVYGDWGSGIVRWERE